MSCVENWPYKCFLAVGFVLCRALGITVFPCCTPCFLAVRHVSLLYVLFPCCKSCFLAVRLVSLLYVMFLVVRLVSLLYVLSCVEH